MATRPLPSGVRTRRCETTPLERAPEHRPRLALLDEREVVDYAVDRFRGVDCVDRDSTRCPVSAADRGRPHGLLVAHLAHEDHVGVLAEHTPERARERDRVPHLALVDDRALVAMQELDRILDRDYVLGVIGVDVVDHGRQGRRLARPGRAGHEDQPALLVRERADHLRQHQLLQRS